MKILITEQLSKNKYKDNSGYLICKDAIIARTGTQQYLSKELFTDGDDSIIVVDRPKEEVLNDKTIASFENKPVTDEHPDVDVVPLNCKDLQIGFARDIHPGKVDGTDVLLATLVITDADAIEMIENGEKVELSCGYDCDIMKDDNGNYYQANIRGNHIALCEAGRAGIARIVDSKVNDDDITTFLRKHKNDIEELLLANGNSATRGSYSAAQYMMDEWESQYNSDFMDVYNDMKKAWRTISNVKWKDSKVEDATKYYFIPRGTKIEAYNTHNFGKDLPLLEGKKSITTKEPIKAINKHDVIELLKDEFDKNYKKLHPMTTWSIITELSQYYKIKDSTIVEDEAKTFIFTIEIQNYEGKYQTKPIDIETKTITIQANSSKEAAEQVINQEKKKNSSFSRFVNVQYKGKTIYLNTSQPDVVATKVKDTITKKVLQAITYFNALGWPKQNELQTVVDFFKLTKAEAKELFGGNGMYKEADYINLKFHDSMLKDTAMTITVQCYILDGDKILIQNRVSDVWHGLAVPGGHVKNDETTETACIREIKEETGLDISNLTLFGTHEYTCEEDGKCIALLYKTSTFSGELQSSDEGDVKWMTIDEVLKSDNTAEGFKDLLTECVGNLVKDSAIKDYSTTTRRQFRHSDLDDKDSWLGTTEWGTPKGSMYVYKEGSTIVAECQGIAYGDPKGTFKFSSLQEFNKWLLDGKMYDSLPKNIQYTKRIIDNRTIFDLKIDGKYVASFDSFNTMIFYISKYSK